MKPNPFDGKTRPSLPTLSDIQRRMVELTGNQLQLEPQTQLQTRSAPRTPPPPNMPSNPTLSKAALYGVAGLAVRALAPHTEAHPAAILLQLLAAFGNAVGPAPHCMVDATRHGLNLFVVLVGESSKARKGTSWNQIRRLFAEVDHPWVADRVTTARLTPAALIYSLRDQQPATDRRLLALSEEFAAVLHSLRRAQGHLSPLLRCAWDSGDLRSLGGLHPIQATGTHISLIATSRSANSQRISTLQKPTTASPTVVSGPGCSAANACRKAAIWTLMNYPPSPPNSAALSIGSTMRTPSASSATTRRELSGTNATRP